MHVKERTRVSKGSKMSSRREKKLFYSCYLIQNTYQTDCDDAENINFYECD